MAGTSWAATDIPFTWKANPKAENISGYHLWMDGTEKVNIMATIIDPLAESYTYTLADDTVSHDFTLTAFRVGEFAAESAHTSPATWEPVVTPPDPITPPTWFEIWKEKIAKWLERWKSRRG